MRTTTSFKRLILRVALRDISPMVIRSVAVSDQLELAELHDIFCAILGWSEDVGYIFRVHGQEFNSFRRKTRTRPLHEFKLHRQEKFLYSCDTLHLWEWCVFRRCRTPIPRGCRTPVPDQGDHVGAKRRWAPLLRWLLVVRQGGSVFA